MTSECTSVPPVHLCTWNGAERYSKTTDVPDIMRGLNRGEPDRVFWGGRDGGRGGGQLAGAQVVEVAVGGLSRGTDREQGTGEQNNGKQTIRPSHRTETE